jgi:hypothetical protein
MNNHFFDQQNLTEEAFVASNEEQINKPKTKELLCPEESCDDFFEILQGTIKRIEESETFDVVNQIQEIPECKFVIKKVNILGEYDPKTTHIKYYPQTPQTLEVIKIHERFHAIHHLMVDDKNKIWEDFAKVDSFYLELLAQLFTFIYIRDIEKSPLDDFNELNEGQPVIYQTFKIFRHYGLQEAIDLYWVIRNQAVKNNIYKLLEGVRVEMNKKTMNTSKTIENAVFNGIRKTINRFREQPFLYFTESDIHASLSKDIMEGNSDILILGNTMAERTKIKTPVSLVHHEYPTNFRFERKLLLNGYNDEDLKQTNLKESHGDRGNYDLSVLNPCFVENLFESHKDNGLKVILEHIINKDKDNAILRNQIEELLFAIEVKFVHLFNARNIQLLHEVKSDNEKLRLAIHHKHCCRGINLIFCSSQKKHRKDGVDPVIEQIRKYIEGYNQSEPIINIFIESFIDDNETKETPKPTFSKNQSGWSDLTKVILKQ